MMLRSIFFDKLQNNIYILVASIAMLNALRLTWHKDIKIDLPGFSISLHRADPPNFLP
jgi:hypothetical protein